MTSKNRLTLKNKNDFKRDLRTVKFALLKIKLREYALWILVSIALAYGFLPLSRNHAPIYEQIPEFTAIFFVWIIAVRAAVILAEPRRKLYPLELRRDKFRFRGHDIISRRNLGLYIFVAFLVSLSALVLIPTSTIGLLTAGSYESTNFSALTTLDLLPYGFSGTIAVSAVGAISVGNPMTMTISLSISRPLPADISSLVFSPSGAFNTTATNLKNGQTVFFAANIPLTYSSGQWYGTRQVVYFNENSSLGGSLTLYDGKTAVQGFPIAYSFPLADESVTYSIVSNSIEIFLTIVIIAFILLEFRTKDGDSKKDKDSDDYIRARGVAG